MSGYDWKDIAAIVAAMTAISGVLIAYLKYRLSGDFAKAADVSALGEEIAKLKTRLDGMPSHADIHALKERVAGVERGVAVVTVKIEGVADLLRGIEKTSDMLLRHQLEQEKNP